MIKLLASFVLILVLLYQIMRIQQLSSEMKDKDFEVVNEKNNRSQGRGMILFLIGFLFFFIWLIWRFKDAMLPEAVSDIGIKTERLFILNWIVIFIVFFITQILLFYFAYKYRKSTKNNKAYYYTNNNKIELFWTIVPFMVLAVLIVYGLSLWGKMTGKPADTALNIQVYAKQFDFIVRYSGADNKLGVTNYRLIDDANNPIGMDSADNKGWDDIVVRDELHLPVNREVNIQCNAREVMHGVYLPHFREQINCVPGMNTYMHFIPTITTDSMRHILHDTAYDYVLVCNRVCGSNHFNMHLKVVVDTKEEFQKWLETKTPQFDAINKRKHDSNTLTMNNLKEKN